MKRRRGQNGPSAVVARAVLERTRETSCAQSLGDIRQAVSPAGITGGSVPTAINYLRRQGVLIPHGRAGRLRYSHRDFPISVPEEGGGRAVEENATVEVIEAYYRKHGQAMPTVEVTRALRERGIIFGRGRSFNQFLDTLCQTLVRGAPSHRAPRIRRLDPPDQGGVRSKFWLPVSAPDGVSHPWRSRAGAVRALVAKAADELGRPVSRSEMLWWRLGHPDVDPLIATGVTEQQVTSTLHDTWRRDASFTGTHGRLHLVESAVTCWGGAAARFALSAPDAHALTRCGIGEVLYVARPADERDGVEDLTRLARELDSEVLAAVADLRHGRLTASVAAYVGANRGRALAQEAASLTTLASWVDRAEGVRDTARYTRHRQVREWRRQLDGLRSVLALAPAGGAGPRVVLVWAEDAQGVRVAPRALEPLGLAAAAQIDLRTPGSWRNLILRPRRFPIPGVRYAQVASRPGGNADITTIDRADALAALVAAAGDSSSAALVSAATHVMGFVLRDAGVLRAFLEQTPAREDYTRHALVVALGMLGSLPEMDLAVPDPHAPADWQAYIVAAAMAELGHGRLIEILAEADANALGSAAQSVTDRALGRAEAGLVMALLG
jgi:hypothetical protein